MILFLLPLILNPFGTILSWLPALYLATWPIIIQTMGRETLLTHALVLILFLLTCHVTRRFMLNLIGFDLLSFPIGIALLVALTTDKGTLFLSMISPLFRGLLVVVEPVFLLIEVYLFMDMIQSFNRWLSKKANARDEDSHDLSSWDPPLARGSVIVRIGVILLTVFSYLGVYMIIQESKILLGPVENVPVNFNHAIAALATLQLIAVSITIYKEEGILSESALVALLASIPIFIASWSFYHLRETSQIQSSNSWTSYFPFSIFSSDPGDGYNTNTNTNQQRLEQTATAQDVDILLMASSRQLPVQQIDFSALENSVNQIGAMDAVSKELLVGLLRRLIMIINSILGLSLDKLAKYYFGPDFWYILVGRLVCLSWWALISLRPGSGSQDEEEALQPIAARSSNRQDRTLLAKAKATWRSINHWLPSRALIKILLVLAYTQMLIQQMDNLEHLQAFEQTNLLGVQQQQEAPCCQTGAADETLDGQSQADLTGWFECMWTSAKACTSLGSEKVRLSRAQRFAGSMRDGLASTMSALTGLLFYFYRLLTSFGSSFRLVSFVWLARWRSPIVQRLIQSMLVQVYYVSCLVFAYE